MSDIVVSLTKKAREMEAQALLYGYGYLINYFVIGSGGHDIGDPTLALPLDLEAEVLPGQFFGPAPIANKALISPTCPRWTCTIGIGEAVGNVSNLGLIATVVYIPEASILLDPAAINPGSTAQVVTINAPATGFNANGHGFISGDKVVFSSTGTLPLGTPTSIDAAAEYYVVNVFPNSFQVSQTIAGLPIILTTVGSGIIKVRSALDDVFTYVGHGFTNADGVVFGTTGTLPSGLAAQVYYVIRATPNTFKISTVQGGAPVDLLTSGTGVLTVTDLNSVPVGAPVVGSQFLYAEANFPLMVKLASVITSFTITLQT